MLSGIQMIYQNEVGKKLPETTGEGRCRICGGPLVGETVLSFKHLSDSWTDEGVAEDRSSPDLCEACAWMTRGKDANGNRTQNKAQIWHSKPCMIVEQDRTRTIEFYDFYQALIQQDFTYPVVLAIHGKHQKATQKHIQWKSGRCVSHSPSLLRVAMSDMYVFDTSNRSMIDGIAQFDLNLWIPYVKNLSKKAKEDILPYLPDAFTDRTKAHTIITMFLTAISSARQLSEATYLAAYLAGYSLFPELGKEVKNA